MILDNLELQLIQTNVKLTSKWSKWVSIYHFSSIERILADIFDAFHRKFCWDMTESGWCLPHFKTQFCRSDQKSFCVCFDTFTLSQTVIVNTLVQSSYNPLHLFNNKTQKSAGFIAALWSCILFKKNAFYQLPSKMLMYRGRYLGLTYRDGNYSIYACLRTNIGQTNMAFICCLVFVVSANWDWDAHLNTHPLWCLNKGPSAKFSGGGRGADGCGVDGCRVQPAGTGTIQH